MKFTSLLLTAFCAVSAHAAETSTYGQRIVAAVLMGEAWGEGERGMTAVAEVIHNRAVQLGKTPLEIVVKRGEFSSLLHRTPQQLYDRYYRKKDFAVALRIAKTCYNTPEKLPGIAKGATYYDNKRNHPYWLSEVVLVASVGNQNFYVPRVP